jgi:Coenzyme PQQ synthesis protein D (PqqD)
LTGLAPRRVDEVVQRDVAGETFLVPIHGRLADLQQLFVLNEVGSWLWERLDGSHQLDDLVRGITAEFEVDDSRAKRDVRSFLKQLSEVSLLRSPISGGA